jgi:FG-GAP repeat.
MLTVQTLPGWSLASVADFNRDDHPDYLLFNQRPARHGFGT